MIGYLLRELALGFVAGMRSVKAYLTRGVLNIWTKLRQATQIARGTTRVMSKVTKNVSQVGQKPTQRSDFIETEQMFISKTLIFRAVFVLIVIIAVSYFLVYPLLMRYFFTARMYSHNARLMEYNGRVIVYYDEKKTVPSYEGYLEKGILQGSGKQYDTNGVLTYDGEFVDGKRSGFGEEYENGELVYRGEFAYNAYEGEGEQYSEGRLTYSGTYKSGKLDGNRCCIYYPNGRLAYRGTFAAGEQTGEGIAYAESGIQSYAGEFLRGTWQGEGTAYNDKGEPCYIGEFRNNLYDGSGTLYLDGFCLEGSFLQGKQSGDVMIRRGGTVYYEGGAVEGRPHGQGTVYNDLGIVLYSGTLRSGTIDGRMLLGKSPDEVRELLGDAWLTTEKKENGVLLTSEELGLCVYFGYSGSQREKLSAFDVFFYRTQTGDSVVQELLWDFAEDIDAWRNEVWHDATVVAGTAIPQLAAQSFGDKSYPCVIYPDGYASSTIWSDGSRTFGIEWTMSGGQSATIEESNLYN